MISFKRTKENVNNAADAVKDAVPGIVKSLNNIYTLTVITVISLVVIAIGMISIARKPRHA